MLRDLLLAMVLLLGAGGVWPAASLRARPAPRPTLRPAPRPTPLRVYALQYGTSTYPWRRIATGPSRRARMPFAWLLYLVESGPRRILVDTGFVGARWRRAFGVSGYLRPDRLLARLGVTPTQITDVVLTHGHFDHAGGLALFSRVRIHLRQATLSALMRSKTLGLGAFLRRARRAGRIRIVRGRQSLGAGLTLEPTGGHTPGHQVLTLRHGARRYVFVGDECYLRSLCVRGVPLPRGSVWSSRRNRAFLRRLRKWHRSGQTVILPFHDPAVMKAYPVHRPGIVRVL